MKDLKELRALISLVDEPDVVLYSQVSRRIIDYGIEALPDLEAAWESTLDDFLQQRIIRIIHDIQQEHIYAELSNWGKFGSNDLLKGFMLVTRFQYPDLELDKVTREVGRIAQEVWLELNNNLTALEKVKVVNHVLFDINKFSGNTANIHSAENFYLKNLLDNRKGNSLSMGMLYVMIAQSLKIPVYGVDLPKHFILAYVDEPHLNLEDEVLFYLNPFNKGAVFTRNEINLYIKQMNLEPNESYFKPCSNLVMIQRMINGLIDAYKLQNNTDKVSELQHLLTSLDF
jgi:regulator of sirC expression with transglutaminase-like and TPR domain